MSTLSPPSPPRFLTADELYESSVDLYLYLIEAGRIDEDECVELLDGMIVKKMTKNPPHVICRGLCGDELARLLPPGFRIWNEDPIRSPPYSMPEPDLAIVRDRLRDYANRHPSPDDLVLVVEVADTSLARDRGLKRDLYAQAGISTYWIVNLIDRRIEVFQKPENGVYTATAVIPEDGTIGLVADGQDWGRVDVATILP